MKTEGQKNVPIMQLKNHEPVTLGTYDNIVLGLFASIRCSNVEYRYCLVTVNNFQYQEQSCLVPAELIPTHS